MSEPWFDPNAFSWIPGTVLGVVGGLLGTLSGIFAPAGRAKSLLLAAWGTAIGVSALLLIIALVALFAGQPYGIWYGFGLPGLLGVVLFSVLLPVVLKRYGEAEQRRMQAKDFA